MSWKDILKEDSLESKILGEIEKEGMCFGNEESEAVC